MQRIKSANDAKKLKFGDQFIIEPQVADDDPEKYAVAYQRLSDQVAAAIQV